MSVGPMHASRWARIVLDELELELSTHAAHLLETLAHIADEQGEAWPSLARLCHRMRLGRTSVKDARAELVRVGLLVAVGRNTGGAGHTARYRLALDVDVHNRPPGRPQPAAGAAAKSQEVPLLETSRDATSRAAPPWIAEGLTYGAWIRRERAAGRVAKHNPPRPQ